VARQRIDRIARGDRARIRVSKRITRPGRRVAALVASACSGALLASASVASVAAPAGASTRVTTVKAIETDFHIALSKKSFTPGRYTFVAVNKGQTTHALEITGPGLHNPTTPDISPGQSARLTVTLKKGTYDFFCPVPGHKELGMNKNVKVALASGAAPATTTSSSPASSGGGGG
jgi:hypothetical protein